MGLEDFLKTVMRLVKREAGELRLYPPHLLCAYLMSEFWNLRDVELGREALSLIMLYLSEALEKHGESLHMYINVLPEHDLYPYIAKLLRP
jgi:hypothetical protein